MHSWMSCTQYCTSMNIPKSKWQVWFWWVSLSVSYLSVFSQNLKFELEANEMKCFILPLEYVQLPISYGTKMSPKLVKALWAHYAQQKVIVHYKILQIKLPVPTVNLHQICSVTAIQDVSGRQHKGQDLLWTFVCQMVDVGTKYNPSYSKQRNETSHTNWLSQ